MKKQLKTILGLALAGVMAFSFAGCGGSGSGGGDAEGTVLNIWCWNTEFQDRFNAYYPGVKEVAEDKSTTTLEDGTVVQWTINPNENNNYQDKLDEALLAQADADADSKIDIFLVENDYALKYADSEATMNIADLGITEEDLAEQYEYTWDFVKDSNGAIKGTSWQATPGLFAYKRSIAKDVLGTDDPEQVQAALADWDKFNEVAEKAKAKGYQMLSGYDDSFRVFSNNVSAPYVTDGETINIDPNLMNWVKQTKDYTDKGYNNKTKLWDPEWNADQGPNGKVFGFFYSTWGINFTLEGNSLADPEGEHAVGNGSYGDYAVCYGPANWFWGGTWICAATGTDNPTLVGDVMRQLTCNKDIMKQITLDTQDYTNNKAAMQELADDPEFGSAFLGGQNHIALFTETASKIDMSNCGPYDQGINEGIQNAFHDYFDGSIDEAKAKANFETAIKEKYPELKTVNWPE